MNFQPAYFRLFESGELAERAIMANQILGDCTVCPRECHVNRLLDHRGHCQVGRLALVSSYGPHHGEENPLSGWHGSGTIFLARCNLNCLYCQNHSISQTGDGMELESEQIADIMLRLQDIGCHNINFVSPSHVVPQLISATLAAVKNGLHIPLVYNSGGYDSLSTIQLLDGIVDIYMPDMKYADAKIAERYSNIQNYPQVNQAAVTEMNRQVGDLVTDINGIALRGLLVRHLVLPNRLAGSAEIIRFLSNEISKSIYLNLMDQYRPAYQAFQYPEINRRLTQAEYQEVVELAQSAGLSRLD
jgi:putative pyruvate formate lyase activating enzyme